MHASYAIVVGIGSIYRGYHGDGVHVVKQVRHIAKFCNLTQSAAGFHTTRVAVEVSSNVRPQECSTNIEFGYFYATLLDSVDHINCEILYVINATVLKSEHFITKQEGKFIVI
jgi:hypothetical protein